jgi:TolA-binding protein
MAIGLWLTAAAAFGQLQVDIRTMATSELYNLAVQQVTAREYEAAAPLLLEVVQRLRQARDEASLQPLEYALFHLALARMETGRHAAAIQNFQAYLQQFPRGWWVKAAHLLWAEVHATQEQWADVRSVMRTLLRDPTLDRREQVWAYRLVGESWFREEQWDEALAPLVFVFENSGEAAVRSLAAVRVTTALIRLERFDDLFRFVPVVYRTSARYDIAMNLALVEAGDRNYEQENYLYAIALYRLVHFKEELAENARLRIEAARQERQLLWEQPGLDWPSMSALQRNLDRRIADETAQLAQLRELPDYDQEVIIRLGRTYLNLRRYWEALTEFRRLYDTWPDHPLAEQALYSAYATALEMGRQERALKEGYDYLDAFPEGEFFAALGVSLVQLHFQREEYPEGIALGDTLLAGHPGHPLRPNLLYLGGYGRFQINETGAARDRFAEVLREHPGSAFVEDASYWHALSQLFLGAYPEALEEFSAFLDGHPDSGYREDATFRRAVAQYGLGAHADAEASLRAFLDAHPGSRLEAEAWCLLGDLAAADSRLEEALARYARVADSAVNMAEVDYALFQSARVHELEANWDPIIRLCNAYLERFGEYANAAQATYWIGTARLRAGREEEAYQAFFDAILAYGDNPDAVGIDWIARDLIQARTRTRGSETFEAFRRRLYRELAGAREGGRRTLALRLVTLFAELLPDGENRDRLIAVLARDENLPVAGPLTLQVIGREAALRHRPALSRSAYEAVLARYGNSDFTAEALWALADASLAQEDYARAEALLRDLVSRYPTLPLAAEAQKRLGDVYRAQEQYDQAVEAYETLLGVRAWRGPLFPEALFWIGICRRAQHRPEEAFAYFQRIYVLYSAYPEWTARAYLESAACLEQVGRHDEAAATLREMTAAEHLPDALRAEGRERLNALRQEQIQPSREPAP